MKAFKITSWNVEWLIDSFSVVTGKAKEKSKTFSGRRPSMVDAQAKLQALRSEILAIDADVLFLIEAIRGADAMLEFCRTYLPEYQLIVHPAGDDKAYDVLGEQWMWFLVKPELAAATEAHLLDLTVWKSYTASVAFRPQADGKWVFSAPQLIKSSQTVGSNIRQQHSHYRHPQVLVMTWEGRRVEIIGAHFKSKHIGMEVPARAAGETDKAYYARADVNWFMANAHLARIKLTTEATDVRYYIDKRFEQEESPIIFVIGDLNDGPGKELIEREYLLHDLIGVLQGDIFFARKFLNHALFDYPQNLRWTSQFQDKLDPARSPNILLDHITFTEALSRVGLGSLVVHAKAGLVEHEIHERINALLSEKAKTSDHAPVSLVVSKRGAPPATNT
ncbi:endonuclease/exonuclease/phosphatase [Neorhizobium galegae]|uniref:endonuclease/exonuclease/phosphatase family protein n=1 Tax=Neorhizobium galegae TaxID=399 RepID=UPI002107D3EA|nr:endonuclease/exonuclease/phosphatase family protein [Neorhizobium galegae]MCQ1778119.1 endonuclease/exonuclease/phosphatase [Neorhizobium galegae]MCQ1796860.1 endonuclease/exonuclease/phosphatase [Neorhizobium galegae]